MPEPLAHGRRYMPGLDGLRALAVTAVVLYHVGFGWAAGGLLGVGVFFTLSGYLITDLLLEQLRRGELRLGRFWLGRARRLLPGFLVMLGIVAAWVAFVGPAQPGFGGAMLAAVFYVSNWQLIFAHVSYFARFGPPSPLSHLWSLGIEEQFYILWPLVLLLGVRIVSERSRVPGLRPRLALLTLLLAAASAAEMAFLYRPSFDTSRIYFGTDTRAFALLAGAALAMVWPSALLRANITAGARRICDAAGAAALAGVAVLVWRTNEYSPFLYRGGFALLSLVTVVAVAALVHPAGRLGRILGVAPLRWIGVRSYGIYLWHMPILALTTPAGQHRVVLGRALIQIAAILALAALSWRFIEQPIRHGALGRAARRRQSRPRLRLPALPRVSPAAPARMVSMVVLLALVAVLTAASGGESESAAARPGAAPAEVRPSPETVLPRLVSATRPRRRAARSQERSSCGSVIDIGDSTSEGLISTDYLPDPKERIDARYDDIGTTVQHYEISGARSIVETYEGEPNAAEVAQDWKRRGYRGCWVLALGTNDTADVAVGSNVGLMARIRQMMSLIGHQPVMWVNVKSLLTTGPYAEHNMQLWNEELLAACHAYKNMRVFDWSAVARSAWFINDGIHYNTPGYAARARLIADALANAFPASGHRSGCLVG